MTDKQTIEVLKKLIKEVKQESRTLVESKQPAKTEQTTLKEYVTRNILEVIRESGG